MSSSQDIDLLIHRYMEGLASRDEVEQLNDALRQHEQVRERFVELLAVDSLLAELSAEQAGSTEETARPVVNSVASSRETPTASSQRTFLRVSMAVTCSVAVLAAMWHWQLPRPAYATVHRGVGTITLADGAQLRGETQTISAGTVELVTSTSARVVIEAPARFQFESPQRLRLSQGRISAQVPHSAKGFTVVTPGGRIVDLGTRFGVDVPAGGATEVHVFDGEVTARPQGGQTAENLRDGAAMILSLGIGTSRDLRSAAFVHTEEMASLKAGVAAGQQVRAEAALDRLRQDPALITLLDFESNDLPEGVYRPVQGRWPGSQALEFLNVGDHAKVDAGGDRTWEQVSLMAWVRLDRLGAPYQSLFHVDGWWEGESSGKLHWMITDNMTMRLALRDNLIKGKEQQQHQYPDSTISVLPERGRWVHLAAVYDSIGQTIRFYCNGEFDNEVVQSLTHPGRLGNSQIGNWNLKDRKLSGRVDEFVLLGRAMSDEEIREFFLAGNPYQ